MYCENRCKCRVLVGCKNAEKTRLSPFDHEELKEHLLGIQNGGNHVMKFKTDNEHDCLQICKFSIFRVMIVLENVIFQKNMAMYWHIGISKATMPV